MQHDGLMLMPTYQSIGTELNFIHLTLMRMHEELSTQYACQNARVHFEIKFRHGIQLRLIRVLL